MENKNQSLITSGDEDDCVMIVDSQNNLEGTMDSLPDQNTQYVLEVEPVQKKKKNTKGKMLVTNQKKAVMSSPLIKWLNNFWQADRTLRVMKPFLKKINEASLKTKNMKLYNVGQALQKIMKEFFIFMKEQGKDLQNCSYSIFEEWCSNVALSTTYGKLHSMDWENDFENTLFDHYSASLLELQKRQEEEDEENGQCQESSSLLNTKNTFMLSTTAHTVDPHVVAHTSSALGTMLHNPQTPMKSTSGRPPKSAMSQKEKYRSLKRKLVTFDEMEDEEYIPGSLYMKKMTTVEDESEPEVTLQVPKNKKTNAIMSEDSGEETPNEEDFSSMVASHARAHCLTTSTGKICQHILIKDEDSYINISSPGERGSMLVKLELYPFKDCTKVSKNQYWTKRTYSCLGVISGEESPVHKLAMKFIVYLCVFD